MDQQYVIENVLPLFDTVSWKPITTIAKEVTDFLMVGVEQDPGIEIWAWYGNYDWVAFCGTLYGNMVAVPPTLPWNVMDLKQYADYLEHTERPASPEGEHNALVDARWNRDYYKVLRDYYKVLRDFDDAQRLQDNKDYYDSGQYVFDNN